MSTYREFRKQFIQADPRAVLGDQSISMFISQSASNKVFIAGISVPFETTSGSSVINFHNTLRDTNTIYVEYSVTSSLPTGPYPYTFASGSDEARNAVFPDLSTLASGSQGYTIRTIEIPIKEVQTRDTHYFMEPEHRVEVPVLLSALGDRTYLPMRIAFSGPEKYYRDDFNPIVNSVDSSRRSSYIFRVNRKQPLNTSITGGVTGTYLPGNFLAIQAGYRSKNLYSSSSVLIPGQFGEPDKPINSYYSSSLRRLEDVDSLLLAEVQDSNYTTKTWINIRYDGVVEDNGGIVGNEPALYFISLNGATYPTGSSPTTIKAISDSDREIETILFTNFANGKALYNKNPSGSNVMLPYALPIQASTSGSRSIISKATSTATEERFTILYKQEGSRVVKIPEAHVYGIDTGLVYITNNEGKVIKAI